MTRSKEITEQQDSSFYFLLQMVVVKWTVLAIKSATNKSRKEKKHTLMRSNSGKDGSRVTSVLCLGLGLDLGNIRSRVNSLGVGAFGLGNECGRRD